MRKVITFTLISTFLAALLTSSFGGTLYRNAYADSYEDGYQTGCYDAGRDYRGLNGHGYDESVHRGDQSFKNGYLPGYRICWSAESKVTTSVSYSASYGKGFSEGCYVKSDIPPRIEENGVILFDPLDYKTQRSAKFQFEATRLDTYDNFDFLFQVAIPK